MKLLRKILLIFSLGFITCLTLFFGIYCIATKNVKLEPEKLLLPDTQVCIFDQAGKKLHGKTPFARREIVELEQLPKHLPDAFVATEDKRFYRHHGFDLHGICRATVKNVKSHSLKEGASTISQQLIKNTHLSQEKTLKRKLKEIKLTRQLEKKYSKPQILETYLNTIYFGHSCYGIADAARFYYGKDADQLTLAESALLAGLIKSPNNYSPFNSQENALQRRTVVLGLMLEQNLITKSQYETAVNAHLPTTYFKSNNNSYANQCLQEMDRILEKAGIPINGKIEIYTYFQPDLQTILEREASSPTCDKTILVINNETHGVEAFLSTLSSSPRQPGSLIKPLLIYAPAFEKGVLSPVSPILDERTDFGDYSPTNYQNEYNGYVSARTAIAKSLNVPAVKTLNTLGLEAIKAYAEKLSLPIPEADQNLSFALGGMTHGYRFKNLVDAYTTFANDGFYSPSNFIKEIKIDGRSVYQVKSDKRSVYSPETAYLITDTLLTTVREGTAKKLRDLPFEIAAKTGTVGAKSGNTDAYTVAYTSEHTIGVWLGNADYSSIDTSGGNLPCSICREIAKTLYQGHTPHPFDQPIGVKSYNVDKYTYEHEHRVLLSDPLAPIHYRQTELFNVRYAPVEQSKLFHAPSVQKPMIEYCNGRVKISYEIAPPNFYRYQVIRTSGKSSKVIYDGKSFTELYDDKLKENTTYEYSIIPYYQEMQGEAVKLPSVYIAKEIPVPPPIVNKPWWEE